MATEDNTTQHQDYIYNIKQLFQNFNKPKSSDFGALIDMADNDPIIRYHEVNGTIEQDIHEAINANLGFTTFYNEVHYFLHAVHGVYMFTDFSQGTYGKDTTKNDDGASGGSNVTRDQFLHIAPHPRLINDDEISEGKTYSSSLIESKFLDTEEGDTFYVSRQHPSTIATDSNINSNSTIRSINIISDLEYVEDASDANNKKGVLRYTTGTDSEPVINNLEINPYVETKLIRVYPTSDADIKRDFNLLPVPVRTFKRGDIILLEHDLTSVFDPSTGTVRNQGVQVYLIVAPFNITDEVFSINEVGFDLVDITGITMAEIQSLYYSKHEIDNLITAAAQGMQATEQNVDRMTAGNTPDKFIYDPTLWAVGTQILVINFYKNDGQKNGFIDNIPDGPDLPSGDPDDGTSLQIQGVFVVKDDSGHKWSYSYQLYTPHKHGWEDMDTEFRWMMMKQEDVSLTNFGAQNGTRPPSGSYHFTGDIKGVVENTEVKAGENKDRLDLLDLAGARIENIETDVTTITDNYLDKRVGGEITTGISVVGSPATHTASMTSFAIEMHNVNTNDFLDIDPTSLKIYNDGSAVGASYSTSGIENLIGASILKWNNSDNELGIGGGYRAGTALTVTGRTRLLADLVITDDAGGATEKYIEFSPTQMRITNGTSGTGLGVYEYNNIRVEESTGGYAGTLSTETVSLGSASMAGVTLDYTGLHIWNPTNGSTKYLNDRIRYDTEDLILFGSSSAGDTRGHVGIGGGPSNATLKVHGSIASTYINTGGGNYKLVVTTSPGTDSQTIYFVTDS